MKKLLEFSKTILRGIGQVMFQNNALTGLVLLAGIFWNSWILGIGALAGVLSGTSTAVLLGYRKKNIEDGLYGFNATLVGIALTYFLQVTPLSFILIIICSAASTVVMNYMYKKNIPPYTFPFVISTWIFLYVAIFFRFIPLQAHQTGSLLNIDFISAFSLGIGQVMFQESIITGIIFLAAIAISSRISALYALMGSLLGIAFAMILSLPIDMINIGLFGFNGVLCSIAFGGKKTSSLPYAMTAVLISVLLMYGISGLGLIALTAPFVFSAWITLWIRKTTDRN